MSDKAGTFNPAAGNRKEEWLNDLTCESEAWKQRLIENERKFQEEMARAQQGPQNTNGKTLDDNGIDIDSFTRPLDSVENYNSSSSRSRNGHKPKRAGTNNSYSNANRDRVESDEVVILNDVNNSFGNPIAYSSSQHAGTDEPSTMVIQLQRQANEINILKRELLEMKELMQAGGASAMNTSMQSGGGGSTGRLLGVAGAGGGAGARAGAAGVQNFAMHSMASPVLSHVNSSALPSPIKSQPSLDR